MLRTAALVCAMAFALGCGRSVDLGEESFAAFGPPPERLLRMAEVFYGRVSNRRFNSIATFQDPGLREFFVSQESFADYFADLVQAFVDNHFEQNRADQYRIESVVMQSPDSALVTVHFRGENSQPLRWWTVTLLRRDQWEQRDGRWLVLPGKV